MRIGNVEWPNYLDILTQTQTNWLYAVKLLEPQRVAQARAAVTITAGSRTPPTASAGQRNPRNGVARAGRHEGNSSERADGHRQCIRTRQCQDVELRIYFEWQHLLVEVLTDESK